ncbi:MAG TPA: hypothetical protein VK155_02500 [Bacteroidales bacterium]|nr:hypothetical protein [Bacteroidales bacterium]
MNKKAYIKPEVKRIDIDWSITIMMLSSPTDPPPRRGSTQPRQDPFQSPFDNNKPFG